MSDPNKQAMITPLVDMLRSVGKESWSEGNGWTYDINIGLLAHQAADEIDILTARAQKAEAEAEQLRGQLAESRDALDRAVGNILKAQASLRL